jgi:cytochrome c oxidase subunit II
MPTKIDSSVVLYGQALAYTLYAFAVMVVMGAFAYKVTRTGSSNRVPTWFFAAWAGLLVVVGVSLHLTTANTIPWVKADLDPAAYPADKTFELTVGNHQFKLPADRLEIKCGEMVRFAVTSQDLTYGFGLFRQDHSMVFQMQVVPGHPNEVLWHFDKDGVYDIRSTEYSGPAGYQMIVPQAVVVTGCGTEGVTQ